MTAPQVIKAYSPAAIKAIETNFQVVSPPIYLTGYLEFQDTLGKNLSEAYVGQLPAKDVLKKTEDEWNADRPPHRPQQAQGGARELQGGDAASATSRRERCHPPMRLGHRAAAPPSAAARAGSRSSRAACHWIPALATTLSPLGEARRAGLAAHCLRQPLAARALPRAARDRAASAGRSSAPLIALVVLRADAGAVPAALFLVPPMDGLSRLLVGRRVRRARSVQRGAHRSALRLGGGALAGLRHRLDASAAS